MGKTKLVAYRVETDTYGVLPYSVKEYGRANSVNFHLFIDKLNESFRVGGINWVHGGRGVQIARAVLIRQRTGEVVAEYGEVGSIEGVGHVKIGINNDREGNV